MNRPDTIGSIDGRSVNVSGPRKYRLESRDPGPRLTHGNIYEGWPVTDMGLIVQTHDDFGRVFGMIPDAPQAYWDADDNRYDYRFITLDSESR